ncbi:MAG: type II secretion system protein M [Pseudomonadota bacterium]|uniref:type II secretion system protein M n=1 Tax=Alcanivorax sp. TaxID=1872427 RepID=UPI0025BE20DB|nr:type II secretion system protein M [Alcanivorax sp.]MED5238332.1 type II secretion system protein M [Pseudomonadota bacterium]MEE3320178.1 type II secretion system protein M [Pseudomonadota bacterium]
MSRASYQKQIQQRLAPVVEWYQTREPREQKVLQLLAAVFVAVLIYWLVWAPSVNARNQAVQRYVSNMQTLEWISTNAAAVKAASRGKTSSLPRNWVGEVSRSANAFGLTLKNFTPDGNTSVRIQMEEQPAGQSILWLQSLQEKGVQITNLEMTPGDKSGTATVRATLQQ